MKFNRRVLSNGITVLHEFRELPVVCFRISNRFGAAHEAANIKGIAHVIEHMLFTGTKKRTHEDISGDIEKRGGILNAFTSHEITSYWFKLPSEHLSLGMEVLTDMFKNSLFEQEKFEKEKKVILEEIKMYHDSPQRHVHEQIEENLYSHPFGLGITGTKESVSNLKRDFMVNYFREKYSSENFVVVLVGNADFEAVCKYLEKEFSRENRKLSIVPIKKINKTSVEERNGIDQAHYIWAAHAPESNSKDKYVLEVLDSYLANGMSSKLFLEIREKRGLAYAIKSSTNTEKSYSYYSIYVGTTKPALGEVEKLILEGFKDSQKMTEKEFEEAKEKLIGLRKVSSEESLSVMNELVFAEMASGNAEEYYKYEKMVRAVRLEDVKRLARDLPKKYSTAAIVPK